MFLFERDLNSSSVAYFIRIRSGRGGEEQSRSVEYDVLSVTKQVPELFHTEESEFSPKQSCWWEVVPFPSARCRVCSRTGAYVLKGSLSSASFFVFPQIFFSVSFLLLRQLLLFPSLPVLWLLLLEPLYLLGLWFSKPLTGGGWYFCT